MGDKDTLPRLNEKTNFSNWKFRLCLILEEKGVSYTLSENVEDGGQAKYLKDDAKARSIIVQCLSDKHLEIIKACATSREMLNKLGETFERRSILNKLHLKKKLITMKCGQSEKLQDFFSRFDAAVSEVKATGCEMFEEDIICQLLTAMPSTYEHIITSIETIFTDKTISLEFTKARLLDAEIKVNHSRSEPTIAASFICYSCRMPGHKASNCAQQRQWIGNHGPRQSFQGRGQSYSSGRGHNTFNGRGQGRGQICQGQGEFQYQSGRTYRGRGSGRSRYRGQNQGHHYGHAAEEVSEYEMLFTAFSVNSEGKDISKGDIRFVVDSGATEHLIKSEYLLCATDVENLDSETKIYVANGQYLTANKRGNLFVQQNGINIKINGLFVEGLSHNLLSVQKLIENKLSVKFSNNSVKIYNNLYEICGHMTGKLYTMDLKLKSHRCFSTSHSNDLWHQRLGHANRKHLAILKLPYSNTPCGPCMEGKSTRLPFKQVSQPRSSYIGELLHTDLSGPVKTPTKEGEVYFHSIIDDYSHFCVVYLLKKKSEAAENIIKYIQFLETQTGNNTRKVRCDNGGEFKNQILIEYCLKRGIDLQFTNAYSPQSNGVAERMNRTIYNKARTLMIETELPKHLWGEAVRCAVYQINRCPSSAINFKIPAEIRYGDSNLSKLKVFGSKAWVVQLPKQNKFEKRAREMRFVGYTVNGYRLWDPETDKVICSRDVRFDENQIKYKIGKEDFENLSKYQSNTDDDQTSGDFNQDEQINRETDIYVKRCFEESQMEIEDEEEELNNNEEEEQQMTTQKHTTRSGREVRQPARFLNYNAEHNINVAYCLLTGEPQNFEEAIVNKEWKEAIDKELNAHKRLETWSEATLPEGVKAIDTKWIFRQKQDGIKKARIVARGYQQNRQEQTYYSPVARMSTIRTLLSYAVQENLKLRQLDVPTAFLNGRLEGDIYIKCPKGLNLKKGNVLKLNKALYGLKEAPKCWNLRFHQFMIENGFEQSKHDFCLYKNKNTRLLIFVDDILILGEEKEILEKLKKEFKVKDLGEVQDYLGLEISRTNNTIVIKQKNMIQKTLEKFNMQECNGVSTPMESHFTPENNEEVINVPFKELIGCLLFISSNSRPDICYSVSYLSRYLDRPTASLWKAGKRILRYLKATEDKGLVYFESNSNHCLLGYSDADWAGDKSDRKSTSGSIIFYNGNPIHWFSKKQTSVALSTAEAEYVAGAVAVSELIYLKGILTDLTMSQVTIETHLLVDNQSAIQMIESFENSKRSKHIDIKAHFIKDIISKKIVTVSYVPSGENVSDIFTKALPMCKHMYFLEKLKLL